MSHPQPSPPPPITTFKSKYTGIDIVTQYKQFNAPLITPHRAKRHDYSPSEVFSMTEEERLAALIETLRRKEWLAEKKKRIENGDLGTSTDVSKDENASSSDVDGGLVKLVRRRSEERKRKKLERDSMDGFGGGQGKRHGGISATQRALSSPDSPAQSPRASDAGSATQSPPQKTSTPRVDAPLSTIIMQCWEEVEYGNLMRVDEQRRLDTSLNDVRIDAAIFKHTQARSPKISIKRFNKLYHEATMKIFYFMELGLSMEEINVLLEKQENIPREDIGVLWQSIQSSPQYEQYKRRCLLREYYVHRAALWAGKKSSGSGGITPRRPKSSKHRKSPTQSPRGSTKSSTKR